MVLCVYVCLEKMELSKSVVGWWNDATYITMTFRGYTYMALDHSRFKFLCTKEKGIKIDISIYG
jgi:hypothetical protein